MKNSGIVRGQIDTIALLCKEARKWVVYFSFDSDAPFEELERNCPVLSEDLYGGDNQGMVCYVTDDSEEAWKVFKSIKGDECDVDYPVYALIIDDNGEVLSENT